MTTEQMTLKRGIRKGLEQGRAGMLLDQLTWKFGPLHDDLRRAIEKASPEQLRTWSTRLLEGARTPEDIVG